MRLDSTNLNEQINQDRIFTIFRIRKQKREFWITWEAPGILWETWSYRHSPHEAPMDLTTVFCDIDDFCSQLYPKAPTNILATPAHRR